MAVSRRQALKTLAAVPIARGFHLQVEDPPLLAIADIVLPTEADKNAAVKAFQDWIAGYREGADTDHGYGNTRVRPTGPSPSRNYAAQIAALETAARSRGAASFAAASRDDRRAILESAITDAKVERIPARPTGGHVATDLMGHYFGSPAATDLCYRAAIGRDACRGLPGSDQPPKRLA
jgi:hypothetical protein